jgi:uncharacterized protein (TIGR03435 family)
MPTRLTAIFFASATLFAQTRPASEVFEVADVHRSALAMNPYTFVSGGVLRGARYDLRKATVLDMIRYAYNVDPDVIVGGPNWLEFDRFDVAAKAPPGTPPATIRLMLQSLLADRFRLVLRRDTRPMPAFALAAGKGKPKLREPEGDHLPDCVYQSSSPGFASWSCHNMTMAGFAERLHNVAGDYLKEPVVDTTGLEGAWDFDVKWNNRTQALAAGVERVTVFKAVDQQLGLSLALVNRPAPVLVIDHVEEKPADNPPDVARKLPPSDLRFEVADLKPSRPDAPGGGMRVTPGGGLEAIAMDMRVLMAAAWDIDWDHLDRFANLPKWIETAKFDIHAKASTDTNSPPLMGSGYIDDDVRLMLRALLVERFKIQWHYEDRAVDAWTLASGGKPKMKKGDTSVRAGCNEARTMANDPRDANPRLSELLVCRNTTMAQFVSRLQPLEPDDFAYPPENATGLAGTWDFMLSFSPAWMVHAASETTQPGAASDPTGAVSLAEAIAKQLGLRLEKRKRMLPVVVIDHMEEKPAEN